MLVGVSGRRVSRQVSRGGDRRGRPGRPIGAPHPARGSRPGRLRHGRPRRAGRSKPPRPLPWRAT